MSELQPAFAGAVGHRLHAAVILVPTPVEYNSGDSPFLRHDGDLLPDFRCLFRLLTTTDFEARNSRDRTPRVVVDQLGIDVLVRPEHDQPRPIRGARDLLAHTHVSQSALRLARA